MILRSGSSIPVLLLFLFISCQTASKRFRAVASNKSGITFNNRITDNEALNVLNYEYIYNGGGVGIGDFNNDSLPDIYFTGNQVPSQLYLNRGGMQFEDVTIAADVAGQNKWCKGVSVVDINNDGWLDIYVCAAVLPDPEMRKNILYINKGTTSKNGIPHFTDRAAEYGLDDPSNTHMAAFFDYDNDNDLDAYLLLNDLDGTYPNEFRPIRKDGSWPNTDKLLQNNWDSTLKHPVFKDVSKAAGISIEGHGLGVNIADINKDGWKDIYVSNDYLSNNILYINNGNGTFTDHCADYFKHTSRNAMGNDIADINNDGLADIIEMDMAPADHYRQKMMYGDINYQTFQNSARFGYMHQYPRNTLQLNRGMVRKAGDTVSQPAFSEIAYFSGVAQTDWSWAPLLADMDNDGYRDLLVSNGLPRDMSDMDFMAYRQNAVARTPLEEVLAQVPTLNVSNYIFSNNRDLTFTDRSKEWGWEQPGFSAGMATADLDNDGDLDVVINNTNGPASLLENTLMQEQIKPHYLDVSLKGGGNNIGALGSLIYIYQPNQQQYYEYTPYRGYMSSIQSGAHFGLGTAGKVDSIVVIWPDRKKQVVRQVTTDGQMVIQRNDASLLADENAWPEQKEGMLTDITPSSGIDHIAAEVDFIDFNIQKLIPHKLTQYGPSLAAGDINGDGRADLVVGGGSPQYAMAYIQNANGAFARQKILDDKALKYQDDAGICLFDADGDGDLDMYIASGGAENEPQSAAYQDHLFENDGRGHFKDMSGVLPSNRATKSCVKAADYDNDGDLDLFVGGRVIPGRYPDRASSFLYRNDSKKGSMAFTDVTYQSAPALQGLGLVTDAIWSDMNNDTRPDLLLTMEWGCVKILENKGSKMEPRQTGLEQYTGLWNSISAADIDNDNDIDYVIGNYGTNGYIQPNEKYPFKAYGRDFDNNGSFDAVFTTFRPVHLGEPLAEVPLAGRDELIKEMTVLKERFPNYTSFAKATLAEILPAAASDSTLQLQANTFQSCWIENKGDFHFVLHVLPHEAQWAPVYATETRDVDHDGSIDILLVGNEFSMAPYLGRYDACNGLMLKGDGKGNFKPVPQAEGGFYVPGNAKTLVYLTSANAELYVAGQNAGPVRVFSRKLEGKIYRPLPDDRSIILHLKNGQRRKAEVYAGSGFQSQSATSLLLDNAIDSIQISDRKGNTRTLRN